MCARLAVEVLRTRLARRTWHPRPGAPTALSYTNQEKNNLAGDTPLMPESLLGRKGSPVHPLTRLYMVYAVLYDHT